MGLQGSGGTVLYQVGFLLIMNLFVFFDTQITLSFIYLIFIVTLAVNGQTYEEIAISDHYAIPFSFFFFFFLLLV